MCALVYNIRRLVTLTSTWSTRNIKNSGNLEFSICQWTNIFIKISLNNLKNILRTDYSSKKTWFY
jgi:hypothetical protein